jgi:hypothetical protein
VVDQLPATSYQLPATSYQPYAYALKSSGDFVRLTNNYTQRQY